MPCFHPLKGYKDIVTGGWTSAKKGNSQTLEVACSQCLGCRIDHSIMWTIRIIHEASLYSDQHGNSWITLTYRSAAECIEQQYQNGLYVPADYSLAPSHVSKFIRALRKKNLDHKIRYFYCGEYGELGRPHYHMCLFNHSFNDQQMFKDDEGLYTYTSPSLDDTWPYGFATVTELNYRTAAYTASYCFKKINGQRAHEHYLRCDEHGEAYWLKPEFIRMSTGRGKPSGLGAKFYEKFHKDIFPSDESPVPGKGIVQLVPRYYQNILESTDPDTLDLVKSLRQTFLRTHAEDFTPERLKSKYIIARQNQNNLKRALP